MSRHLGNNERPENTVDWVGKVVLEQNRLQPCVCASLMYHPVALSLYLPPFFLPMAVDSFKNFLRPGGALAPDWWPMGSSTV
jgi:hypothetical protein